jgi:hypothetical protein
MNAAAAARKSKGKAITSSSDSVPYFHAVYNLNNVTE